MKGSENYGPGGPARRPLSSPRGEDAPEPVVGLARALEGRASQVRGAIAPTPVLIQHKCVECGWHTEKTKYGWFEVCVFVFDTAFRAAT